LSNHNQKAKSLTWPAAILSDPMGEERGEDIFPPE
jgi:hypothetical protein